MKGITQCCSVCPELDTWVTLSWRRAHSRQLSSSRGAGPETKLVNPAVVWPQENDTRGTVILLFWPVQPSHYLLREPRGSTDRHRSGSH